MPYTLVENQRQLEDCVSKLLEKPVLSLDTETTALFPLDGKLRLIQFSDGENNYIIDCFKFYNYQEIAQQLSKVLENKKIKKVLHNAKFDMQWIKHHLGLNVPTVFDTMLAHQLVNFSMVKGANRLDTLLHKYLGISVSKEQQKSDWSGELTEEQLEYAATDTQHLIKLREVLFREIVATSQLDIAKIEFDFIPVVAEAELRGIPIRRKKYEELIDIINKEKIERAKELENFIYQGKKRDILLQDDLFGGHSVVKKEDDIEIDSHAQILKAYKNLGYDLESTGKDVLEPLALDIPELKILVEYRKAAKLCSTYGESFLGLVHPKTGRIHTNFRQIGAKCITGESLIPTSEGFFRISDVRNDLKDGQQVEFKTNIVNRYRNLETTSNIVKFKNRETIRITTDLGFEIEGTYDHPLISNVYNFSDYQRKRYALRIKNEFFNSDNERWKTLDSLKIGDFLKIPVGYDGFSKKYVHLAEPMLYEGRGKIVKIPNTVTEELAEFLGIFYADGSIHDLNGTFSIRISNRDNEVSERFKHLSRQLFDIEAVYYESGGCTSITAKSLAVLEEMLSLKRHCYLKTVPDFILKSPKSVVAAFLRGLTLDSTVCVERRKIYLKYTVSNKQSALDIQTLLLAFGIVASVRKLSDCNAWNITIYNENYVKFCEHIGFIQSKKYKFCKERLWTSPKYAVDSGNSCIWVKVKSKLSGVNDVYDFTVPETHSFISNGFISHNTGRMSSSPNMQNPPREARFRECFGVDSEDDSLVICDYGQLELRILASFSRDKAMIHAFDNDIDLHTLTCSRVFGLTMEQAAKNKEKRVAAKTANFSIAYGISAPALMNRIRQQGVRISEDECKSLIDGFYKSYPQAASWLFNQEKIAVRDRKIIGTAGKLIRLNFDSSDNKQVSGAKRDGRNFPIQQANSVYLKLAARKIYDELKHRGHDSGCINFVHDEIMTHQKRDIADDVKEIVEKNMIEAAYTYIKNVKIKADAGICTNWSEKA